MRPTRRILWFQIEIATATANHIRRPICDAEVEKPVRCCRDGHSLRADLERVDFGGNDPADRTPGSGIEKDKARDESDEKLSDQLLHILANDSGGYGNNHLADGHAYGADDQQLPPAPTLYDKKARDGGDNVDDIHDE